MPHDFCLLFDAVAREWPAFAISIAISAERVAHQWQPPASALLRLPDVDHFVDEQALRQKPGAGEIVMIMRACRGKVHMPHRRHHRADRLEREPAAATYANGVRIDCPTENTENQRAFALSQRALPAGRAGRACGRHILLMSWSMPDMSWSSIAPPPIASIFAGTLALSPLSSVIVISVMPPALSVSSTLNSMT